MIEFRVVIIYRENKGEKKKKNAEILVCFSEWTMMTSPFITSRMIPQGTPAMDIFMMAKN